MNTQVQAAHFDAQRQFESERSSDIIVRLDDAGYILDASDNAVRLGIDLEAQLVMPHIADFAEPEFRSRVTRYFVQVIAGEDDGEGIEFPVARSLTDRRYNDDQRVQPGLVLLENSEQRYNLSLSCIAQEGGEGLGAVGTLRLIKSASAKHGEAEDFLPFAAKSDPYTGLADRRRFAGALSETLAAQTPASVTVFAIDSMRAIFMQYGQNTADEIRWGFARFLEAMIEPGFTLTQIDEERFGVVLPGKRPSEARDWARDALQTFGALAVPSKGCKPQLGASAGIAKVELSAEWTIRQAELGLVMARSAGGMQAAICRPHSSLSNGRSVEQAMETVVDWTSRRKIR